MIPAVRVLLRPGGIKSALALINVKPELDEGPHGQHAQRNLLVFLVAVEQVLFFPVDQSVKMVGVAARFSGTANHDFPGVIHDDKPAPDDGIRQPAAHAVHQDPGRRSRTKIFFVNHAVVV